MLWNRPSFSFLIKSFKNLLKRLLTIQTWRRCQASKPSRRPSLSSTLSDLQIQIQIQIQKETQIQIQMLWCIHYCQVLYLAWKYKYKRSYKYKRKYKYKGCDASVTVKYFIRPATQPTSDSHNNNNDDDVREIFQTLVFYFLNLILWMMMGQMDQITFHVGFAQLVWIGQAVIWPFLPGKSNIKLLMKLGNFIWKLCILFIYLNVIWTLYSILTSSIFAKLRINRFTMMRVASSERMK